MTSIPNRYCQHLGIPVPRIEDVVARPDVTLFQLVVMALLERGGPMTVDEIAARLDRAALPARLARPDFVAAVKKAWHGQPPLVRDGDERVGMPYELGDLDETYTRSGRIVHLEDLVARGHRRIVYEYDFGDGWTHTIEIDDVQDEEGRRLACLDGARACPPEDCGGVDGYHHLLEILFDPTHQEFEESRQWVGPAFEPERFDLRLVNQQLGRQ